jgi:hypothetical protein
MLTARPTRRQPARPRALRRRSARRRTIVLAQPEPPEDAAGYVCGCGTAFIAAVTANVTCPACGDSQAW